MPVFTVGRLSATEGRSQWTGGHQEHGTYTWWALVSCYAAKWMGPEDSVLNRMSQIQSETRTAHSSFLTWVAEGKKKKQKKHRPECGIMSPEGRG